MFNFLKSIFSPDPLKKIRKMRDQKYKLALSLQRNGKLREYAKIIKEIEDLEIKYVELSSKEQQ
tara:strand:- start:29 stop:220 length:192 start_codon:yes stop_codon:yes gene_type:complete